MKNRRRVSVHVLVCLVLSALVLTSAPADAARLNLHRGSRGVYVTMLETRLARLWLLTPSAVDRRYRAATVNSVRTFQRLMGLRATGKVNRAAVEPDRARARPARSPRAPRPSPATAAPSPAGWPRTRCSR